MDNFKGPKISLTSSGTDALELVENAGFTIPPISWKIKKSYLSYLTFGDKLFSVEVNRSIRW